LSIFKLQAKTSTLVSDARLSSMPHHSFCEATQRRPMDSGNRSTRGFPLSIHGRRQGRTSQVFAPPPQRGYLKKNSYKLKGNQILILWNNCLFSFDTTPTAVKATRPTINSSIVVCICCRGKVSTQQLPSKVTGIHIQT
jgi:hypothetical protein